MAPRAEDEQPDPPSAESPDGDDGSRRPLGPDAEPTPAPTQDEQWDQIVARLAGLDPPVDPVTPRVVRPALPDDDVTPVPDEDGRVLSGRDWDGTATMDAAERLVDEEEHFVPPDPGPVLGGDPLTTMAWLAVVGMPALWLVVLLGWRSAPTVLLQASGAVFVAGLAVLVWRMPHRRDPDDDGAQV